MSEEAEQPRFPDDLISVPMAPGENSVEREVMRLRWWKAEAIAVLDGWERVWVALGRPGPLGASKAAACEAEVARLRLVQDSLLEQLSRMAGAS